MADPLFDARAEVIKDRECPGCGDAIDNHMRSGCLDEHGGIRCVCLMQAADIELVYGAWKHAGLG